jgi:exodeoxyribonuclease VII large subunit
LITSFDSAAYHDFVSELKHSGYAFRVFIINSIMQGKNTEGSIIKALGRLQGMDEIDVIVITRGGGSIAELSCFDSEKIAMAIANSSLPVLSAIGHEINTTVTDLTAHTFVKTPTAIARFLVERLEDFLRGVDERQERILRSARQVLVDWNDHLRDAAMLLQTQTQGLIKGQHQRIAGMTEGLKRVQAARIRQSGRSLADHQEQLKKIICLHLQNSRAKINQFQKMVELADPRNTLKRGFSITRSVDGQLIRCVKDAQGIKGISTQVVDGVIYSDVRQIKG